MDHICPLESLLEITTGSESIWIVSRIPTTPELETGTRRAVMREKHGERREEMSDVRSEKSKEKT